MTDRESRLLRLCFLIGITVYSGQPGYFLFDFSMIDVLS